MVLNGVKNNFWKDVPSQVKLYYAIKVEGVITAYGYDIFRCKKQWAARLILQEAMKSDRQVEGRRVTVMYTVLILSFFILCVK